MDLHETSLAFPGPSVWNTLAAAIKTIGTMEWYKTELQKHLMSVGVPIQEIVSAVLGLLE